MIPAATRQPGRRSFGSFAPARCHPLAARRPDAATYDAVASHLEAKLDAAAKIEPNPGRLPLFHRLTRTEYKNADSRSPRRSTISQRMSISICCCRPTIRAADSTTSQIFCSCRRRSSSNICPRLRSSALLRSAISRCLRSSTCIGCRNSSTRNIRRRAHRSAREAAPLSARICRWMVNIASISSWPMHRASLINSRLPSTTSACA